MKNLGFSIIECMLVIAIITAGYLLAIPNMQRFEHAYVGKLTMDRLQLVLHYAQSLAAAQQSTVLLCPSSDGSNCATAWQHGVLVKVKDTKQYFKLPTASAALTLKQSGHSNNRILILVNGMLDMNGHFNYKHRMQADWPEFNLYFNKALRTYIKHS